jgi:hypothetical protein
LETIPHHFTTTLWKWNNYSPFETQHEGRNEIQPEHLREDIKASSQEITKEIKVLHEDKGLPGTKQNWN